MSCVEINVTITKIRSDTELIGKIEATGGLKRACIRKTITLAKGANVLVSASELAEIGITSGWQVMAVHGRLSGAVFPHPAINDSGNSSADYCISILVETSQIKAICSSAWSSRAVCVVIDYIDL